MSVFLANPNNRYDLSALLAYGDLKYLTEEFINPFNTDHCIELLRAGLEGFDPDEDYICMTGNLQIISFMMMIAYKKFSTFRVLMFDATQSNYKERVIVNE
jgi:hypothetical protein